jgi:hypothetical protein
MVYQRPSLPNLEALLRQQHLQHNGDSDAATDTGGADTDTDTDTDGGNVSSISSASGGGSGKQYVTKFGSESKVKVKVKVVKTGVRGGGREGRRYERGDLKSILFDSRFAYPSECDFFHYPPSSSSDIETKTETETKTDHKTGASDPVCRQLPTLWPPRDGVTCPSTQGTAATAMANTNSDTTTATKTIATTTKATNTSDTNSATTTKTSTAGAAVDPPYVRIRKPSAADLSEPRESTHQGTVRHITSHCTTLHHITSVYGSTVCDEL